MQPKHYLMQAISKKMQANLDAIVRIAINQKLSKFVTLIGIFSILRSEFLKLENGNKLNDRDFAK